MKDDRVLIYVNTETEGNVLPYVNGFTKTLYSKHTANPEVDLVDPRTLYGVYGKDFNEVYRTVSRLPKEKFYYPIPISLWSLVDVFKRVEIGKKIIGRVKQGRCKILLLCPFEGWTWKWWDKLVEVLKYKYQLEDSHIVILNGNYQKHPTIKTVTFSVWERQMYSNYGNDKHYELFHSKIDETIRPNKYICLNRRPTIHRYATVTELLDLKNQGILTCAKSAGYGDEYTDWVERSFFEDYPELKEKFINKVKPLIPIKYKDGINPEIDNPASNEWGAIQKYHDSYLYIVTESFFENKAQGEDTLFLSEKTFKPIVFMQPFVTIARPGTVNLLKELGYKTCEGYIDESYDKIQDDKERLNAAIRSIKEFVSKDRNEMQEIMIKMKPIFEHNFNLLKQRHDVIIHDNLKKDLNNALYGID